MLEDNITLHSHFQKNKPSANIGGLGGGDPVTFSRYIVR
jgi:hypothetical protein